MGKSRKTTTQEVQPVAWAQPGIQQAYQSGIGVMNSTAPLTPTLGKDFQSAFEMVRGLQPQLLGAARQVASFAQEGNPYTDRLVSDVSDDIGDSVNSIFSSMGRYGSGAHQKQMAREIGRQATSIRANSLLDQMRAASALPSMVRDAARPLLDIADIQYQDEGARLREPIERARIGSGLISIAQPYTNSTTTQSSSGGIGSALGLASLIAAPFTAGTSLLGNLGAGASVLGNTARLFR